MKKLLSVLVFLGLLVIIQMIIPMNTSRAELEVLNSTSYEIYGDYISKIKTGTTVKEFLKNVYIVFPLGNDRCEIYKGDKKVADTDLVSTGMEIKVITGTNFPFEYYSYKLAVRGDVNGDGKITVTDLSMLKTHLVKTKVLSNEYLKAIDVDYNGKVGITDLSKLKLMLLGLYDETAPTKTTVELQDYVSNTWTNRDVIQTFTAEDEGSGIAKFQYKEVDSIVDIFENNWIDVTNPFTLKEEGEYIIRVRAVDKMGNIGEASDEYTVKIDKTLPVEFELQAQKENTSITILAETTDELSGIAKYEYKINDGEWSTENVFSDLTIGEEYTVYARAIDNAGNIREATNNGLSIVL